jgi:hypothetical protein
MFLVLPPLAGRGAQPSMAGMSASAVGSRSSFLALPMALFMFGYVVRVADRLLARAPALARPPADWSPAPAAGVPADGMPASAADNATGSHPARPLLAPRRAALYKIAMGMTMGYMLVTML